MFASDQFAEEGGCEVPQTRHVACTHLRLQALRSLQRNGLVARRVVPVSLVAVEYSVTPLGRTLEQPFAALYGWTVEHLSDIEQAQREFDGRTGGSASARSRGVGPNQTTT